MNVLHNNIKQIHSGMKYTVHWDVIAIFVVAHSDIVTCMTLNVDTGVYPVC